MTEELGSYQDYKVSRLPSLGMIPSHWNELRAKYIFKEVDERSSTGKEELLSVSHKTGVTPRSQKNVTMFLAKSNVGYKVCRPGDIAVNTMWAWMAALGVSRYTGLISPSYGVYRPNRAHDTLDPKFIDELLRTEIYRTEYIKRSTGVNSSRLRLYPEQFLKIPIVIPPANEQAAIAKYLSDLDQKVNRYVKAKRKAVALLEEQRKAIVLRAVCRGLDSSVKLKASEVDWIGDIPVHWEVKRLKWLADIKTGGRDTVHKTESGQYPFFVRSQIVERIDSYSFDGEAVLTAGDGAGVGKVFHHAFGKFDYHQRVYKFSNFRGLNGRYFFHYVRETLKFEAFRETAKSTVDSLRLPLLKDFPVPVPPLEEQERIAASVDRETHYLNLALEVAANEIKLIREYRNRLTTDIVTGKLDVRAAAAKLPDVVPEAEPLDEIDEVLQDESAAEDFEVAEAA